MTETIVAYLANTLHQSTWHRTPSTRLCNKLEDYFVSTKSSYLGGDTPSASDVCVAIWMHHNNNNNAVMGPATTTWTNAVCSLAVIQEFCATTEHITEQLTTLTMDDGNLILAKLKEWNIPHSVYSHPLCHSAEELVATVPIPINDSHTKNLLLKDKKHGMFLFVVATKSLRSLLASLTVEAQHILGGSAPDDDGDGSHGLNVSVLSRSEEHTSELQSRP